MAKKIVKDIKIFTNGKWESLKGQKIFYNGKWVEFNSGSGIKYGGYWNIIN